MMPAYPGDAAVAPGGRMPVLRQLLRQLRVPQPRPAVGPRCSNSAAAATTVRCPALSLAHESGQVSGRTSAQDRREAEDYAGALLRRQVVFSSSDSSPEGEEDRTAFASVSCPRELAELMLRNLQESFAVLLDCRLRAYAALVARATAAAPEAAPRAAQALAALLAMRQHLVISSASLKLDVAEEEAMATLEADGDNGIGDDIPLLMKAQLAVCFVASAGDSRTIAVKIAAPGHVKDVRDTLQAVPSVDIEIDTQKLLSEMINQASLVISSIHDIAMPAGSAQLETKVQRSASFLVMPPPPAKPPQMAVPSTSGLEILSQAAAGLFGSDRTHIPSQDPTQESSLQNVSVVSDDEEVAVSCLSPEQCASIVDDVFEELDDDFCLGPPAKRFKDSEEAPRSTRGTIC